MVRFCLLSLCLLALSLPAHASGFLSIASTPNNKDFAVGFGESMEDAQKNALEQCGQHGNKGCAVRMSVAGGCAALARDAKNEHLGMGIHTTNAAARQTAISQCHDGGRYSGCSVFYDRCATN